MLSEDILRSAALACYRNAEALYEDAKLLAEHGRGARAVALAIIGLEEFAKAIVYVLGALLPAQHDKLLKGMGALNFHEVKHLIASATEGAQIMTRDYVDGVEWHTGFTMSSDERLAALFEALGQHGIGQLIGTVAEAKAFYKQMKKESSERDAAWEAVASSGYEYLPEIERKNAALYVDLAPDGRLRTPERVEDRADSEILGLSWFFDQYGRLPEVLEDEAAWRKFAALVRL